MKCTPFPNAYVLMSCFCDTGDAITGLDVDTVLALASDIMIKYRRNLAKLLEDLCIVPSMQDTQG